MVRIDGRRVLAEELESLRRVLEWHPQEKGWDQQSLRAYSLLKTPRFRQALNLNNEKPDLLSKYGHGRTGRACIMGDAAFAARPHAAAGTAKAAEDAWVLVDELTRRGWLPAPVAQHARRRAKS
mgnify:CR=1 FL=1